MAFGEVRRFFVVMRVRCLMPSGPGLFKGDAILLDECQELIRRTRMDVIAVLTGVIIDLLGAQLLHNLDLSTSFRGDSVGDGGSYRGYYSISHYGYVI
jgi:hypothetical protein